MVNGKIKDKQDIILDLENLVVNVEVTGIIEGKNMSVNENLDNELHYNFEFRFYIKHPSISLSTIEKKYY